MTTYHTTRKRLAAVLLTILITALTFAYGQRFRRLPDWSRDLYPYSLYPSSP